uniref:NADH-ubiquinone oxidoreductase chain 6 n=1 Tax=Glaucidium cuculoides TaxID=543873 RepID=A0A1U9VYR0_9STRI|nr:NADH dehydrogenase subunit 6 [Glaucidium cuculoides]AQY15774.1 NADH dehydrogenase subunit 6 [Glaucidium cuculoides]
MTYFMVFSGVGLVLGGLAVASNPSPYYGVLGLVLGSLSGCGWLLNLGVSFVPLVLFMVYLGGMLVVFVYSVALAADPFPEFWGDWRIVWQGVGLVVVLVMGMGVVEWWGSVGGVVGVSAIWVDCGGVSMFYSCGVGMFLAAGWGLLLTLFVVLELVRGLSRGAIRAV